MAVKIKLEREIRGQNVTYHEYYSEKLVTKDDVKKADWIDPLTDIDEDELLGIFDEKYLNEEKTKHSWWH